MRGIISDPLKNHWSSWPWICTVSRFQPCSNTFPFFSWLCVIWNIRGEVVRHVVSACGVYCEVWNRMWMRSCMKDQCVSPRHMRTAAIQKWDMTWQAAWAYVVCVSVCLRTFALGPMANSIISIHLSTHCQSKVYEHLTFLTFYCYY